MGLCKKRDRKKNSEVEVVFFGDESEKRWRKVTFIISMLVIVIIGIIPYVVSAKSLYFDNYPFSTIVTIALMCFLNGDGGAGLLFAFMHFAIVVISTLLVIFAHFFHKKWLIPLNLILAADIFVSLCQWNLLSVLMALGIIILGKLSCRTEDGSRTGDGSL